MRGVPAGVGSSRVIVNIPSAGAGAAPKEKSKRGRKSKKEEKGESKPEKQDATKAGEKTDAASSKDAQKMKGRKRKDDDDESDNDEPYQPVTEILFKRGKSKSATAANAEKKKTVLKRKIDIEKLWARKAKMDEAKLSERTRSKRRIKK
eukprot:GEZU01002479.1.p1 GENE.GEZU01002479.1~~GEZU01002479.1.p1  ORF type:complete len:161 (-),score=54.07 GEZU01002479.1:42-488(-)